MRGRAGMIVALLSVAAAPHACVGDLPAIAGSSPDPGDAADVSFEDTSGQPDRADAPDAGDARPGACSFAPLLEPPGAAPGCSGFAVAKEDTTTDADENCDGYTGNLVRSRRIAVGDRLRDVALATGPQGTVFLGGSYAGTFTFRTEAVVESPGGVFLAALLDGNAQWYERWGNAEPDRLRGITANRAGQVLAYAEFASPVDLGSGTLEPGDGVSPRAAWGSYSLQGSRLWSRMPRGEGDSATSNALAAIGQHAFAVVYAADRPVALAEGATLPDGTSIVVLDTRRGTYVSHFALAPALFPALVVTSLVADSCDNLYVAGKVTGRQRIADEVELGEEHSTSAFLVKLRPSGTGYAYERGRVIAQGADLTSTHVATLRDGSVVITSDIVRPIALGSGCDAIENYGQSDVLVARFDAELGCLFATVVGDGNPAAAYALAADPYGNTVLGATRQEDQQTFVALTKLDAWGRVLWSRDVSPGKLVLGALSVDEYDYLNVAGTFAESADFGHGPMIVGTDLEAVFLATYSP